MFGPGGVARDLTGEAGDAFVIFSDFFPSTPRPATASNPLFLKKSRRVHLGKRKLGWRILSPLLGAMSNIFIFPPRAVPWFLSLDRLDGYKRDLLFGFRFFVKALLQGGSRRKTILKESAIEFIHPVIILHLFQIDRGPDHIRKIHSRFLQAVQEIAHGLSQLQFKI